MDCKMSCTGVLLVVLMIMGFSGAEVEDPRSHPNLSPFEKWRSAYDCLQNTSSSCTAKYQLTPVGWVNVSSADTTTYCNNGCAAHTRDLLSCLHDVMIDYKFEDGNKIKDINNTITLGCMSGFTGKAIPYSSARMVQISMPTTYVSALAAWILIAYMKM